MGVKSLSRVVLALSGLIAMASPAVGQDLSIAGRLANQIRLVLPGSVVTIPDPNGIDIRFEGQSSSLGIDSVHEACAQSTTKCDEAIQTYASRAGQHMMGLVPPKREQLRIVVRSREYLSRANAQIGYSDSFVYDYLVTDLVSLCFVDLPRIQRPIKGSELTNLQIDPQEALSTCKANSKAALPNLRSQWKSLPAQAIGSLQTGGDVSGYLAAVDDWGPLAKKLGGLIVAIPSNEVILYASGTRETDVEALLILAREMMAQATIPISSSVFRWSETGWQPAY